MRKLYCICVALMMFYSVSCISDSASKPELKPVVKNSGLNEKNISSDKNADTPDEVFAWMYTSSNNKLLSIDFVIGCNKILISTYTDYYCLDAITGEQIWTNKGYLFKNSAIKDNIIVHETPDKRLVAIDINTGETKWKSEINFPTVAPLTIVDDKVYFGCENSNIYCCDLATGKIIWNHDTEDKILSNIVVDANNLYYLSKNAFHCIDITNREKVWDVDQKKYQIRPSNIDVEFNTTTSKIDLSGSHLFFSVDNGRMICVDSENGDLVWVKDNNYYTTPSFCINENKLYVSDSSGTYCIDALTGKQIWDSTQGCDYTPAYCNGKLFVGRWCLDSSNGEILFTVSSNGIVQTAYDRVYYVSSSTRSIYCSTMNAVELIEHASNESSNLLQLKNDGKVTMGYYDNSISFIKNGAYVGKSPHSANPIMFPDNREKRFLKVGNTIIIDTGSTYTGIDSMTGLEVWSIVKEALWIKEVTDREFVLTDNTGNVTRIEAATGKKTIDRPKAKDSEVTSSNNPIKFTLDLKKYEGPFNIVQLKTGHILLKFMLGNNRGEIFYRYALITSDGELVFETGMSLSTYDEFWMSDEYLYYVENGDYSDKPVKRINLASNTITETTKNAIPEGKQEITIEGQGRYCDESKIDKKIKECTNLDKVEILKKTGIKLEMKNDDPKRNIFSQSLSVGCASDYIYCSKYTISCSDGCGCEMLIDMIGVYDSKTWKKLWSVESNTSQVKLYKDKLLLTDNKIFDLKNGKLLYELKNESVADIAGSLCLVYSPKIRTEDFSLLEEIKTTLKITALDLDMIAAGKK